MAGNRWVLLGRGIAEEAPGGPWDRNQGMEAATMLELGGKASI